VQVRGHLTGRTDLCLSGVLSRTQMLGLVHRPVDLSKLLIP